MAAYREDRALALFSYLLIMTSGALVVAVRLGFQLSVWITLAATSVGRGWDAVGHRAGTYRNRLEIR